MKFTKLLKYKKFFCFISLLLILSSLSYIIICVNNGRMGIPKEFQKTLTINRDSINKSKLNGFEIRDNFLIANGKDVSLTLEMKNIIQNYKYMTIFIETTNIIEDINIYFRKVNEKFQNKGKTIKLKYGVNLITLDKDLYKDVLAEIRIDFKRNSDIIVEFKSIEFSRHPLAPNNAIYIFCALFVIWAILLYLILYCNFLQFLEIRPLLILAIIIILQTGNIIYYANQKNNFHVDEMFTYSDMATTRHKSLPKSGKEAEKFISVSQENRFNYGGILKAMSDVHAPFFYFQINTVASFFVGVFSKWFGISINIFWFILTSILLYFTSRFIFKDSLLSLFLNLLWGFSFIAVNMSLYIRAYCVLTFFSLLLLYLSYKIIDKQNLKLKFYIILSLTFFFGLFSHYYFIIWTIAISMLLSIWLIAAKRYDDIKHFAISLVCGFGVNILFFPRVINNILQTGRGKQSFIQLFVFKDFYNDFIRYSNIIDRSIFNFTVKIWIFLLFLLFLIYLLRKCLKNSFTFSDETAIFNLPNIIGNIANLFYCPKTLKINAYSYKIIFTIAASFLYLLIIVKIAPYKADRYISLIFPSIVISFLSLIYVCVFNNAYKFRFININKNSLKYICLIFITFSIVIIGFFKEPKLHLYHYDKYKSLSFSKLYKGSQIIHTNNSWIIYADIFRWFEYDDIFIMDEDDNLISKIKDISGDLENLKTIIVHVDYPLKKEFIKTVNDLGYEIKFFYKGVYRFTPKQNKG